MQPLGRHGRGEERVAQNLRTYVGKDMYILLLLPQLLPVFKEFTGLGKHSAFL